MSEELANITGPEVAQVIAGWTVRAFMNGVVVETSGDDGSAPSPPVTG